MLACHHTHWSPKVGHMSKLHKSQTSPSGKMNLIGWYVHTLYPVYIRMNVYSIHQDFSPIFYFEGEITPDFPSKPQFFAKIFRAFKTTNSTEVLKGKGSSSRGGAASVFRVFCFKPPWENVGFYHKIIQKLDEIRCFFCFLFQTSTVGF